ncbi:MAG: DUF3108 domain-containing protein [Elusimicrobiota bacterium]|jgi:hypothetical protein
MIINRSVIPVQACKSVIPAEAYVPVIAAKAGLARSVIPAKAGIQLSCLAWVFLFLCPCLACAQDPLGQGEFFRSPQEHVRGKIESSSMSAVFPWFPEVLRFEVKWGLLSVGWATMKIEEIQDFAGKPAFHIVSDAKSNAFCDAFYKVRDLNESWIDVSDLRSLGYSKKLHEGDFFRDEWVRFDYERKAFFSKRFDKDGVVVSSSGTLAGTPVQDMLSSIYYLRPKSLKVGESVILDVNTKSDWPLIVKVLRKEKITVPAGTFNTVLVEPAVRKEGIFVQKGNRLQVWLTDDERHVPVFMSVQVFFGHVSAYLLKGP